jgi:hypothetical protein
VTGPVLLAPILVIFVALIGALIATAEFGAVKARLDQIIATQDAVRVSQQKTVFLQHESILSAVREKCK